MAVGLVVELGRRRVAEARPDRASPSPKKRSSSVAQVRVLDRREQLAQVALEALDRDVGLGREVLGSYSPGSASRSSASLIFEPQRSLDLEDAADEDRRAGRGERVERLGVLPGRPPRRCRWRRRASAAARARRCACAAARARGPRRRRATRWPSSSSRSGTRCGGVVLAAARRDVSISALLDSMPESKVETGGGRRNGSACSQSDARRASGRGRPRRSRRPARGRR